MTVKELLLEIERCRLEDELFNENAIVKFWDGDEYVECNRPEFHEYNEGEFHIA